MADIRGRLLPGLSPEDRLIALKLDPETALQRWGIYDEVVTEASRSSGPQGLDADAMKNLIMMTYTHIMQFGGDFFIHARAGRADIVLRLLQTGIPVNIRELRTGFTALHHAAAGSARPLLRVLLNQPDCDCTIRDRSGRLASELAHDPAILRLLLRKQFRQGRERGLNVRRRTTEPVGR